MAAIVGSDAEQDNNNDEEIQSLSRGQRKHRKQLAIADEMEVHRRVLALVPAPHLHSSCNGVVHQELSVVNDAVDKVVAGFSELQEIRKATAKLQGTSSIGGRSATLSEAMDCTMKLQQELKEALDKLKPCVVADRSENKRVRKSVRGVDADLKPRKEAKRTESSSDASSTEESSSEASGSESSTSSESEVESISEHDVDKFKTATNASRLQGTEPYQQTLPEDADAAEDEKDPWGSPSVVEINAVIQDATTFLPVVDRDAILPELLRGLIASVDADVSCQHRDRVCSSLQTVAGWANQSAGHFREEYLGLVKSIEAYLTRAPIAQGKDDIESLGKTLSNALNGITSAPFHCPPPSDRRISRTVTSLQEMENMNTITREKHLLQLVATFKRMTSTTANISAGLQLLAPVHQWINQRHKSPQEKVRCRILCDILRGFGLRQPDESSKRMILDLRKQILDVLAETQSHDPQAQLALLNSDTDKTLRHIQKFAKQATSYKDLNNLFNRVESLVNCVAAGWHPHQDPRIQKSARLLSKHISRVCDANTEQIKRGRLSRIAKWNLETTKLK